MLAELSLHLPSFLRTYDPVNPAELARRQGVVDYIRTRLPDKQDYIDDEIDDLRQEILKYQRSVQTGTRIQASMAGAGAAALARHAGMATMEVAGKQFVPGASVIRDMMITGQSLRIGGSPVEALSRRNELPVLSPKKAWRGIRGLWQNGKRDKALLASASYVGTLAFLPPILLRKGFNRIATFVHEPKESKQFFRTLHAAPNMNEAVIRRAFAEVAQQAVDNHKDPAEAITTVVRNLARQWDNKRERGSSIEDPQQYWKLLEYGASAAQYSLNSLKDKVRQTPKTVSERGFFNAYYKKMYKDAQHSHIGRAVLTGKAGVMTAGNAVLSIPEYFYGLVFADKVLKYAFNSVAPYVKESQTWNELTKGRQGAIRVPHEGARNPVAQTDPVTPTQPQVLPNHGEAVTPPSPAAPEIDPTYELAMKVDALQKTEPTVAGVPVSQLNGKSVRWSDVNGDIIDERYSSNLQYRNTTSEALKELELAVVPQGVGVARRFVGGRFFTTHTGYHSFFEYLRQKVEGGSVTDEQIAIPSATIPEIEANMKKLSSEHLQFKVSVDGHEEQWEITQIERMRGPEIISKLYQENVPDDRMFWQTKYPGHDLFYMCSLPNLHDPLDAEWAHIKSVSDLMKLYTTNKAEYERYFDAHKYMVWAIPVATK